MAAKRKKSKSKLGSINYTLDARSSYRQAEEALANGNCSRGLAYFTSAVESGAGASELKELRTKTRLAVASCFIRSCDESKTE